MRIKWFAHAAMLIEADGLRIITDPYVPECTGFAPIIESADIVIRSSVDDEGHCNAAMIPGNPAVLTATDIGLEGAAVRGLTVLGIPSQESVVHKAVPRDNAMYRFTLAGIHVAHLGDVGNRLTEDQLTALAGTDVLLVPAGGPPTIGLDDLCAALQVIQPRVTIPMHYHLPGLKANLLPVTEFTRRFPPERVTWIDGPELHLNEFAAEPRVFVLKPSTTY